MGGYRRTLNEIAQQSNVGMQIYETQLPIKPQVNAACEFLGLDPLFVANEGKLVAFCPPDKADQLVAAMRQHPKGKGRSYHRRGFLRTI